MCLSEWLLVIPLQGMAGTAVEFLSRARVPCERSHFPSTYTVNLQLAITQFSLLLMFWSVAYHWGCCPSLSLPCAYGLSFSPPWELGLSLQLALFFCVLPFCFHDFYLFLLAFDSWSSSLSPCFLAISIISHKRL